MIRFLLYKVRLVNYSFEVRRICILPDSIANKCMFARELDRLLTFMGFAINPLMSGSIPPSYTIRKGAKKARCKGKFPCSLDDHVSFNLV